MILSPKKSLPSFITYLKEENIFHILPSFEISSIIMLKINFKKLHKKFVL
jgi:hypothetical protein